MSLYSYRKIENLKKKSQTENIDHHPKRRIKQNSV